MRLGVAVAKKGAPFMKLFKTEASERSEADQAAAARLMAITNRLGTGRSPDPAMEAAPEPQAPEEPEDPQ